jgi:phospholipase C
MEESFDIRTAAPILPQIKTIVHLMFENRAFDNLLGWLYETERPKNMVPPYPEGPRYDGLRENAYWLPLQPHYWSPVSWYPIKKGVGSDGTTTPNLDPNEDYPHVLNQMFGNAQNTVNVPPPDGTTPAMQGFLQDFDADDDTWDETLQITETYTPNDCPILNACARLFAVSDRWYCSMPTQTNPNRAFSLCGTSLGRLVNLHLSAIEQFQTPTIWNVLAQKNVSMGIYYHEIWHNSQCYTQYTFPYMNQVSSNLLKVVKIDDPTNGFYARARAGTLPAYSYIEPKWGYGVSYDTCVQGNDYHPPTDITPGEKLLYDVYKALRSGPGWKNTLLIVTFDEHGGTYDHHSPIWGAINPGDPLSLKSPFDFHLFGVRVPTLLISPYVPAGTVFRAPFTSPQPYDHTSILATLLRWQGINPATAGLYDRVAAAPTFEGVLRPEIVNPGAELDDPAPRLKPAPPATHILEGIPAATKKYIVLKSRSLDDITRLAADYRAHAKE